MAKRKRPTQGSIAHRLDSTRRQLLINDRYGGRVWLDLDQCCELVALLPGVIEELMESERVWLNERNGDDGHT